MPNSTRSKWDFAKRDRLHHTWTNSILNCSLRPHCHDTSVTIRLPRHPSGRAPGVLSRCGMLMSCFLATISMLLSIPEPTTVLGLAPRASHMATKCSSTQVHFYLSLSWHRHLCTHDNSWVRSECHRKGQRVWFTCRNGFRVKRPGRACCTVLGPEVPFILFCFF